MQAGKRLHKFAVISRQNHQVSSTNQFIRLTIIGLSRSSLAPGSLRYRSKLVMIFIIIQKDLQNVFTAPSLFSKDDTLFTIRSCRLSCTFSEFLLQTMVVREP